MHVFMLRNIDVVSLYNFMIFTSHRLYYTDYYSINTRMGFRTKLLCTISGTAGDILLIHCSATVHVGLCSGDR